MILIPILFFVFSRDMFQDVDALTLKKLLEQHEMDFMMFDYDITVFTKMLKEKESS